jgi:hypothetical protein
MPIVQPDNTQYAGGYLPRGNDVAARNDRAGSTNTYTADGEVVGMGMHRPRPNEPSMTLDDVDERACAPRPLSPPTRALRLLRRGRPPHRASGRDGVGRADPAPRLRGRDDDEPGRRRAQGRPRIAAGGYGGPAPSLPGSPAAQAAS